MCTLSTSLRSLLAFALLSLAACGAPSMDERLTQARLSLAQVNTLPAHPSPEQMKAAKGIALLSIVQGGAGLGGEGREHGGQPHGWRPLPAGRVRCLPHL